MGVRLYNPTTGRFLQVDPIYGAGCNAYEYTCADPVDKADLDGKWPCWTKKCMLKAAAKALKSAKMYTQQVKTAVSTLNDQELAQLAARADKAQADFAAGNLTERDLILIILGIAVLVLIIVAVR